MNRGVEIDSQVADGPYSVILEQVTNGVAVRMAVLYLLTTQGRLATQDQSVANGQTVGQEGPDVQAESGAWDEHTLPKRAVGQ